MQLKLLIFCFTMGSWKTDAKFYPANTVAIVGDTVTMNCSISMSGFETATWRHVSSYTSITSSISSGGNVSSERYDLIADPERGQYYDLLIRQTIETDAGTYVCTETNQKAGTKGTIKYSAQLILLISDPKCGTHISRSSRTLAVDEDVSMWCKLEYRGRLTPLMVWMHGGHGRVIPAKEEIRDPNHKMESRISVRVGLCENGVTFSCTIHFSAPTAVNASSGWSLVTANDAPKYTYKWISPKLTVTQFSWNDPRAVALVFFVTLLSIAVILLGAILIKIYYEKQREKNFDLPQRGDAATKKDTCRVVGDRYENGNEIQKKSEILDECKSSHIHVNPDTESARGSTTDDKLVYDTVG